MHVPEPIQNKTCCFLFANIFSWYFSTKIYRICFCIGNIVALQLSIQSISNNLRIRDAYVRYNDGSEEEYGIWGSWTYNLDNNCDTLLIIFSPTKSVNEISNCVHTASPTNIPTKHPSITPTFVPTDITSVKKKKKKLHIFCSKIYIKKNINHFFFMYCEKYFIGIHLQPNHH